jgi:hypothetical protein
MWMRSLHPASHVDARPADSDGGDHLLEPLGRATRPNVPNANSTPAPPHQARSASASHPAARHMLQKRCGHTTAAG